MVRYLISDIESAMEMANESSFMTHDPWPLYYFILRMGPWCQSILVYNYGTMVVLDNPLGLESKNRRLKLSLQI